MEDYADVSAWDTRVVIGEGSLVTVGARLLAREGYSLVLAARNTSKLATLAAETGAAAHVCDASDAASVAALFDALPTGPAVVIYNPSFRVRGPLIDLDPAEVKKTIDICAFGAFLVARHAAGRSCSPAPRRA